MNVNRHSTECTSRFGGRGTAKHAVAVAAILLLAGCEGWKEDIRSIVAYGGDEDNSSELADRHPEELKETPPPSIVPKPRPDLGITQGPDAFSADDAYGADPEELIGRNERQVKATLGTPAAQRDVPPAKIWHYSEDDCVISVYFYLNLESQVFQALRYEIVERPRSAIEGRECYAMLVASRRQPQKREG
ncbi:MAG: hypothetical protein GY791_09000 [Alphaproteobacteria bacterium]|nr:hypothetical protein [Alphaproteobacteria bacterium]